MWKRKDLKIKARKVVKSNYWTALIVCFLLALFTSEFGTSIVLIWQGEDSVDPNYIVKQENIVSNNEKAKEELNEIKEKEEEFQEKKSSFNQLQIVIMETIKANINNLFKSEKYIFRIWDAIKSFGINEIGLGIGLILISIIALIYIILIAEPLRVAGRKYFILASKEQNTKMGVMKEIFKKGNWKNVTYVMFLKNLYNLLWFLTIIGGIVKFYEYRMIPFILANDPGINKKEAFELSKKMMKGNKWKAFLLDISFVLWYILSIFTFGLLNILYVNIYKASTETELYNTLRDNNIVEKNES